MLKGQPWTLGHLIPGSRPSWLGVRATSLVTDRAMILSPDILLDPWISPFQLKSQVQNALPPVNGNKLVSLSRSQFPPPSPPPTLKGSCPRYTLRPIPALEFLTLRKEGLLERAGAKVMSAVVSWAWEVSESLGMTRGDGEPGKALARSPVVRLLARRLGLAVELGTGASEAA